MKFGLGGRWGGKGNKTFGWAEISTGNQVFSTFIHGMYHWSELTTRCETLFKHVNERFNINKFSPFAGRVPKSVREGCTATHMDQNRVDL